jgi:phosphoglycolate phosphatase
VLLNTIIFDLDGTLVDTSGDIIDCLKKAYQKCKISLRDAAITRSFIGPPLTEMIKSATPHISEGETSAVVREFRRCYDRGDYRRTKLYDGVRELLINLLDAGVRLFLVTNKPRVPTGKILKILDMNFFRDVVTPDVQTGHAYDKTEMVYFLIRKWGLLKAFTAIVGDSPSDVLAAHSNGIVAISVLSGYGDPGELRASKPHYILDKTTDLYNFIENQRGQR